MSKKSDGNIKILISADTTSLESSMANLEERIERVTDSMERALQDQQRVTDETRRTADNLRDTADNTNDVADNTDNVAKSLKEKLVEAFNKVKDKITNTTTNLKNFFSLSPSEMVSTLKSKLAGAFDNVKTKITNTADKVKAFFQLSPAEMASTIKGKLVSAFENVKDKIGNARETLNKFGDKIHDIAKNAAAKLKDKMLDALTAIKGKIPEVASTLYNGLVTGVQTAVNAIKSFTTEAIATGSEFEHSVSQIGATLGYSTTALADSTSEQSKNLEALSEKAQEMGKLTSFSATEAADGLNVLAMAGYDAETSIALIEPVLRTAEAGGLAIADAASYVAGSMKGFTNEAGNFANATEQATYYADIMAKGATMANTNVQALGEAMSDASSTANAYGQSSETTAVALLRLAEQNVTGTAASTALAAAMKNLYSPTDTAKNVMEELGVSAYDAEGNARDLTDVVSDLQGALSNYSGEEQISKIDAIFGIQGQEAYLKMISTSEEKVQQFYDGISEASGSATLQAETMLDNLQGSVTLFKSALQGLEITFYNTFGDGLKDVVDLASTYIGQLDQATSEGGLSGLAREIGPVLAGILTDLSAYFPDIIATGNGIFKSLIQGIKRSIPQLTDTAFETIDLLATGIVENLPYIMELGAKIFNNLTRGLQEHLPDLINICFEIVNFLIENLDEAILGLLSIGGQIAYMLITGIIENLPQTLDILVASFVSLVEGLLGLIGELGPALFEIAMSVISLLASYLIENIQPLIDALMPCITMIVEFIANNIGPFLEGVMTVITAIVNVIIDNAGTFTYAILHIITTLAECLTENISPIVEALVYFIEQMVALIIENADTFILAILEIAVAVGKVVLELIPEAVKLLAKLVEGAAKGILQGAKKIHEAFDDMWDRVCDFFDGLSLTGYGEYLMEGLKQGISNKIQAIKDTVTDVANNIKNTFCDLFGIASPSKVMKREVGVYITEGVTEGMLDELPDATQEMKLGLNSSISSLTSQNGLQNLLSNLNLSSIVQQLGAISQGVAVSAIPAYATPVVQSVQNITNTPQQQIASNDTNLYVSVQLDGELLAEGMAEHIDRRQGVTLALKQRGLSL